VPDIAPAYSRLVTADSIAALVSRCGLPAVFGGSLIEGEGVIEALALELDERRGLSALEVRVIVRTSRRFGREPHTGGACPLGVLESGLGPARPRQLDAPARALQVHRPLELHEPGRGPVASSSRPQPAPSSGTTGSLITIAESGQPEELGGA
jgi:hypothetical protein